MTGHVEFCVGLAEYKGDLLITFSFQDNAAYILKVSPKVLVDFVINCGIICILIVFLGAQ